VTATRRRGGWGAQRGRDAEVQLGQDFEASGAVVGSRRHIPGPGDVLVVWGPVAGDSEYVDEVAQFGPVWLVEVKTTTDGPWKNCSLMDRAVLRARARTVGATPLVAWRPPRAKGWQLLGEAAWPRTPEIGAVR
jgi:hypothetical protein